MFCYPTSVLRLPYVLLPHLCTQAALCSVTSPLYAGCLLPHLCTQAASYPTSVRRLPPTPPSVLRMPYVLLPHLCTQAALCSVTSPLYAGCLLSSRPTSVVSFSRVVGQKTSCYALLSHFAGFVGATPCCG